MTRPVILHRSHYQPLLDGLGQHIVKGSARLIGDAWLAATAQPVAWRLEVWRHPAGGEHKGFLHLRTRGATYEELVDLRRAIYRRLAVKWPRELPNGKRVESLTIERSGLTGPDWLGRPTGIDLLRVEVNA